jgi:hypothetical protein
MSQDQKQEPCSDQDVVERCLAGDHAGWLELDRRYRERLVLFCHQVLTRQYDRPDWNLAVEVVQNVLISLFKHHGQRLRSWRPEQRRFFTHLCFFARRAIRGLVQIREEQARHEQALTSQSLQEEAERQMAKSDGEVDTPCDDGLSPRFTKAEWTFLERNFNRVDMARYYTPGYYRKLKAQIEKKLPSLQIPPYPEAGT